MNPKTILVIDDSQTIRVLLRATLEEENYRTLEAEDGLAGYELAHREQPDLILLDIVMPVKNGYEICRMLKSDSKTEHIPIIFLTVKSGAVDVVKGFELGAADYVAKTADISVVLARMRTQLKVKEYACQLIQQNNELAALNKELLDANSELKRIAVMDPLTGILNRGAFEEHLEMEHVRFKRYHHPYSIAMADVDNFKNYNDTYGHPAGDEALRRIARTLQDNCREVDTFARYGGEEFALLLPETDVAYAQIALERLRALVWHENILHEKNQGLGRLTLSFGFSTAANSDTPAIECLKEADEALYAAKKLGKNRAVGFFEINNFLERHQCQQKF